MEKKTVSLWVLRADYSAQLAVWQYKKQVTPPT